MRLPTAAACFALSCAALAAQTPAPAAASKPVAPVLPPQIVDQAIGFSFGLPADWEALASPQAQTDVPYPSALGPKKGNACAQVELTARRGTPSSVVVVVALPFDCYGQVLTEKNLADFAGGAAEGLKQTFEVTEPLVTNYALGSHALWAERARGTVKGQPGSQYTLEMACTVLNKGAACWIVLAADADSLRIFEQQPLVLEGEQYQAIVPAGTFANSSSPAPEKLF